MSLDIQTLMAGAVLVLMALTVFRGGQRQGQTSPVGTARLQTDVTDLKQRVAVMESNLQSIQHDLERAPTTADFERLAGDLREVRAVMEGVRGHVESVDAAVVRIELMINKLTPEVPSKPASRSRR